MLKSIRSKIISIIVGSLLVLGVVFVVYAVLVNDESSRSHMRLVEEELMFESERVNKTIRELQQGASHLAVFGRAMYDCGGGDLMLSAPDAVRDNVAAMRDAVGGGVWFEPFALDPARERMCLYACRAADGEVEMQPDFDSARYDYPRQRWYTQIRERTTPDAPVSWSSAYEDDLGTHALMATVGAAIFDEGGRFVGMSTVDWKIQEMVTQLCALQPTPGSFVTLLDPRFGGVVASTRSRAESAAGDPTGEEPEWKEAAPGFNDREITVRPARIDGEEMLSFGRRLDNGMLVLVYVPPDELDAVTDRHNYAALVCGVLLMIGVLAFALWFLTAHVTRPLTQLVEKVRTLGTGRLDTLFDVRGDDEIALLGNTFNRMTGDLKKHIDNLKSVTAARERLESELKVAREIQRGILPKNALPHLQRGAFEIDAFLNPAREVGGDLYDFFTPGDDNRLCAVIGDVSGKGVPAALFMAVTQTLHRGLSRSGRLSPGKLVGSMNNALCNNNAAGMFVTYTFASIDPATGKMTYSNAGHNPFARISAAGQVEVSAKRHGIPLGVRGDREYGESELRLESGDTLFFYTDGIPEAKNASGEFFGMERLLNVLKQAAEAHPSPAELNAAVRRELEKFTAGAEQFDDITALALRISPV